MKSAELRKYRALAHSLKPVVMIGQSGLTPAVLEEIEIALNHHELIKIKIRAERDERKEYTEQICTQTQAQLIQLIGQIAVVYRFNPKKKR